MAYTIVTVPSSEWLPAPLIGELVRRDYSAVAKESYPVEEFVRCNFLSYYLLTNTWCFICQDIGGTGLAACLKLTLESQGLIATIRQSAVFADSLIQKIHLNETYADIETPGCFCEEARKLKPKEALQVLRFGKRFAPTVPKKHSKLAEQSIEKFLHNMDEAKVTAERLKQGNKKFCRRLAIARQIVQEIVRDFPGFGDARPRFGPGTVRNCTNTPYAKYEYLIRIGSYWPKNPVTGFIPIQHPDLEMKRRKDENGNWSLGNLDRPHLGGLGQFPQVARVSTVPKNYKDDRIVAPEDVHNMSKQLQLHDMLLDRIRTSRFGMTHMPITNQDTMKRVSYYATVLNNWATVDRSHASDSVTKTLVQMLFPDDWYRAFLTCVPTGFILSEKDRGPRRMETFATMGCGCTFSVEDITFFSTQLATVIERKLIAAEKLVLQGILHSLPDWKDLSDPEGVYAMGDDCIIPNYCVDSLIEFEQWLGFSVNREKTFANGLFRESCGAEWLFNTETNRAESVQSVYWPRIPVKGTWDEWIATVYNHWVNGASQMSCGIARIIALQHSLWDVSPSASNFLAEALRSYAPQMTASKPHTVCNDVWANETRAVQCIFVSGHVPERYRRVHYDLIQDYLPDGYVVYDNFPEFRQVASEAQLAHLEDTVRFAYVREAHYTWRTGGALPDFNPSIAENLHLELALQGQPSEVGPEIHLVENGQLKLSESLGNLLSFGSPAIGVSALFGKSYVRHTWCIE